MNGGASAVPVPTNWTVGGGVGPLMVTSPSSAEIVGLVHPGGEQISRSAGVTGMRSGVPEAPVPPTARNEIVASRIVPCGLFGPRLPAAIWMVPRVLSTMFASEESNEFDSATCTPFADGSESTTWRMAASKRTFNWYASIGRVPVLIINRTSKVVPGAGEEIGGSNEIVTVCCAAGAARAVDGLDGLRPGSRVATSANAIVKRQQWDARKIGMIR
jgi:hypothetical protein